MGYWPSGRLPKHVHASLDIYLFFLWMLVHAFVLMLGLNPGVVPRVASRTVVPAPFGSCLIYLCGAPNEAVKKKMAGYWPSSFFACLWTETKSRSMSSHKKTRRISSRLDRTNLVNKVFIILFSWKFFLRDIVGSSERARMLHLARSGS